MRGFRGVAVALTLARSLSAQQPEIGNPPGRLYDVGGGRRLHLVCSGTQSPTVVIEAGASSFAIDFTLVQQQLARTTRVCAYDRAGHGWSDPAPSAHNIASDLNALLRVAGERPPFVLVGASMGGLYVRSYTASYPDQVAGLVLIDPSSEERLFTFYNGEGVAIAELTAEQYRSTIPPGSVNVPRRAPQTGVPFDRLPGELYDLRVKLDQRLIAAIPSVISYETRVAGAEAERARLAGLRELTSKNPQPLGDRPVVVLSRGVDASSEMVEVHRNIAKLSTNSRHSVIAGAGHEIHLFEPAAVVQAITDVIEALRSKSRLPAR
jgi:pimeloyl-ACP methyl ester carboxylesterase